MFVKAELMGMTLNQLKALEITSPADEAIMQEVLDYKIKDNPVLQENIFRGDVPEITNPEEEAYWQRIIDERTEEAKKPTFTELKQQAVKVELEKEIEDIEKQTKLIEEIVDDTSEMIKPIEDVIPVKNKGGRPKKVK